MPDDPAHDPARAPEPGDLPNEDEVAHEFPSADDRPLREQGDLHDRSGDDIRHYTGEPVETELGTVTPQQMATGADSVVGGGEYPDAPPRGVGRDDDEPGSRGVRDDGERGDVDARSDADGGSAA